jgi:ATP:ADP antiporter, AAA family
VFITATYLFFAVSLLGLLRRLLVRAAGHRRGERAMVFFVWFSVFNLFATMVFWALMADRFSLEQSKRLFGVIAVGGTLGAIAGPWLASCSRAARHAGLLPVAALLGLAVVAAWAVTRLHPRRAEAAGAAAARADERAVIGGSAWEGFRRCSARPTCSAFPPTC